MTPFEVAADLRIGSVIEVSGTAIRVELDGDMTELTRSHAGRVYPVGQMASVVKIHFGRRILFAYVRLLRMRSELDIEIGAAAPPPNEDSRILEADLFGEGVWNLAKEKLEFERGIKTYPLPLQAVYLSTQDELQKLYEGAEQAVDNGIDPLVDIGSYAGVEGAVCRANINKLFGHHCAVLGSTGSGKSATVAAVLHAVLKKTTGKGSEVLQPRIVIIDPHGEYAAAFGKSALVYRAYDTQAGGEEAKRLPLKLPYWLMSADEFRSLVIGKTEEEATSQNNIIYKAIGHARMAQKGMIEAAKDWGGTNDANAEPDRPRPKGATTALQVAAFDRDTPIPFSLQEFISHIVKEQGFSFKSGSWSKMSPTEFSKGFRSVLDKLAVLRADSRLAFMMKDYAVGDADLAEIIEQFVGKNEAATSGVRIIDISGLPNEVAGPLAALIARLLFQYKVWQTREERERDPLLLVCEEAHRYVPNKGEAEYAAAQQAIRRIAREGRKYGLGLMLVSQRPSDVESTVLSQCNSWLIMRLTNAMDQEHVGRFLPDSLAGLTRILSSLSRREAIFVGEAAAIPARITIRNLEKNELPDSNDIHFADGWAKPPITKADISKVVKRWRRE